MDVRIIDKHGGQSSSTAVGILPGKGPTQYGPQFHPRHPT